MRTANMEKQPYLRPQDIVVAIKIALLHDRDITFPMLGAELNISVSEAFNSVNRLNASRLVRKDTQAVHPNKPGILEFLIHGVKYAFPAQFGPPTRGMLTALDATELKGEFAPSPDTRYVWPDSKGTDKGISILPFYPKVPIAAQLDPDLYRVLALIDVIRSGAARERTRAADALKAHL